MTNKNEHVLNFINHEEKMQVKTLMRYNNTFTKVARFCKWSPIPNVDMFFDILYFGGTSVNWSSHSWKIYLQYMLNLKNHSVI